MEESLDLVTRLETRLLIELDNLQVEMNYINEEEDMSNEVFFKDRTQIIRILLQIL